MMGNLFILGHVQPSEIMALRSHEMQWFNEWIELSYKKEQGEDPDKIITG